MEIRWSGAWQVTSQEYYRYYTTGGATGLIEDVVKDANLQRLKIAVGATTDLDTVAESTIMSYAAKHYIYDTTTGNIKQILTGGTGSCCGG